MKVYEKSHLAVFIRITISLAFGQREGFFWNSIVPYGDERVDGRGWSARRRGCGLVGWRRELSGIEAKNFALRLWAQNQVQMRESIPE